MKLNFRYYFLFLFFGASTSVIFAQNIDFNKNSNTGNLYIRMYGELRYTQPILKDVFSPGQFDATRVVALFGYQFDRNTQFVTEWELEHAKEIYLEQAYIKYRIASNTSFKAGLLLIPMGIINESHEPNNYYGVERPLIDRSLIPSTWRDMGMGINGLFPSLEIKYQLYLVNGLLSYKGGDAKFNGQTNYRSGRQKASKTILSGLPSLSAQIEYYGLKNGKIGLSFYTGRSNSDAYSGIDRSDKMKRQQADSTTIYTTMIGLHMTNDIGLWNLKSQIIFSNNNGVDAYNKKVASDLGKAALGLYFEIGRPFTKNKKWIIFGRYAYLNNFIDQGSTTKNNIGLNHIITTGLNFKAAKGAVFKLDLQVSNIHEDPNYLINSGIGVWF